VNSRNWRAFENVLDLLSSRRSYGGETGGIVGWDIVNQAKILNPESELARGR